MSASVSPTADNLHSADKLGYVQATKDYISNTKLVAFSGNLVVYVKNIEYKNHFSNLVERVKNLVKDVLHCTPFAAAWYSPKYFSAAFLTVTILPALPASVTSVTDKVVDIVKKSNLMEKMVVGGLAILLLPPVVYPHIASVAAAIYTAKNIQNRALESKAV